RSTKRRLPSPSLPTTNSDSLPLGGAPLFSNHFLPGFLSSFSLQTVLRATRGPYGGWRAVSSSFCPASRPFCSVRITIFIHEHSFPSQRPCPQAHRPGPRRTEAAVRLARRSRGGGDPGPG